jgi:16S rRNA processing protein RimM
MIDEELVLLGVCGKPHGIKGGFHFNLENCDDSVLKKNSKVLLKPSSKQSSISPDGESFVIQSISFGHKVMVYLEGITDRNLVESMVPFEIYVDRSSFPEIDEDEFYISDLIGIDVFSQETGEKVGTVKNYYDNSVQTVLIIEGEESLELPFVDHFFPVVDIENNRIEVNIPKVIG